MTTSLEVISDREIKILVSTKGRKLPQKIKKFPANFDEYEKIYLKFWK